MTNDEITIIITTFNSDQKIKECLASIDGKYKVIVVENSDNKEFKTFLENKYPNVHCLIAGKNLGYSAGNNLALKKVVTKYSLILNPDTILRQDSISNFFLTAEKNSNFAIIGPVNGQVDTLENKNESNLIEVNNIKGFAMFLNMEKFSQIGFFDENFFLYFEEIDLCRRVKKFSEKIYIDPSITIKHIGGASVESSSSYQLELNRNWHWMWSTFYYHKKYMGFFIAILMIMPKFFSALFKSLFYLVISDKENKNIYLKRLSGLINSIVGKKSWHRPTLD